MYELLGIPTAKRIESLSNLNTSNWTLVREIARDIKSHPQEWRSARHLMCEDVRYWDSILYRVLRFQAGAWDTEYRNFVAFVKVLKFNWSSTIPQMLLELDELDIGIEGFFGLERNVSYRLAALLNDVQIIGREVVGDEFLDIGGFIAQASSAFLPPLVYDLEEYGLPRMISRRIHDAGVVNLESTEVSLHATLNELQGIGFQRIVDEAATMDEFDQYILKHFLEGITPNLSSTLS